MQFRNEYVQYKAEAQRLSVALNHAEGHLAAQLRMLGEKDRDSQVRIVELENINNNLTVVNRESIIEVQRLDRDLRQIL